MYVKQYDPDRDEILIECGQCGVSTDHRVGQPNMDYLDEFQEYTNPVFVCPNCNGVTVVNVNIPEFEEMEIEQIELDMPSNEVAARTAIRELMWKKRPDLKKKSRGTEREKFKKQNAAHIEKQKQNVKTYRNYGNNPPFEVGPGGEVTRNVRP